jgi:hypothetical protein
MFQKQVINGFSNTVYNIFNRQVGKTLNPVKQ